MYFTLSSENSQLEKESVNSVKTCQSVATNLRELAFLAHTKKLVYRRKYQLQLNEMNRQTENRLKLFWRDAEIG